MKKAFTLIELLVVIAIIAILAAILFPVFAQAKLAAKKAQDISNVKQKQTSLLIYAGDADDTLPLTYPDNRGNNLFDWPANRRGATGAQLSLFQSHYGNSMYPYIKNDQMFRGPQHVTAWNPFGAQTPTPTRDNGYGMNSYLNGWIATASDSPALVVSFWSDKADHYIPGFGMTFPLIFVRVGATGTNQTFLNPTSVPAPWTFRRTGDLCVTGYWIYSGTVASPGWKENTYGTGSNMAYLDGHAKFQKFGDPNNPIGINTTTGVLSYYWSITYEAGCTHSYTLSPMRDF